MLMEIKRLYLDRENIDFEKYFSPNGNRSDACCTDLVKELSKKGIAVSTAESCTGGLIAKLITDVPGSSSVLNGGIVAYTNDVKMNVLGISLETIEKHTEISFECAAEMAECTRKLFGADIGISTTGFAGPTGGNENDPVGTVYVGFSTKTDLTVYRLSFGDRASRSDVRDGTAYFAIRHIFANLERL